MSSTDVEEQASKRRGVEFTKDIGKKDWGTYAMLQDHDGNEFWLIEEKT